MLPFSSDISSAESRAVGDITISIFTILSVILFCSLDLEFVPGVRHPIFSRICAFIRLDVSNISCASKLRSELLPSVPFNFEFLLYLVNFKVVRRDEGVDGGKAEVNEALNDE